MNMDYLRLIFAIIATYFISSCDKHKWDDTKNMFKSHDHAESGNDDGH